MAIYQLLCDSAAGPSCPFLGISSVPQADGEHKPWSQQHHPNVQGTWHHLHRVLSLGARMAFIKRDLQGSVPGAAQMTTQLSLVNTGIN